VPTSVSPNIAQVALTHSVDYAMCLGMVKEARNKGLKAPVILMGARACGYSTRALTDRDGQQVTIILSSLMGRKKPSKTPARLAPMVSLLLTCLRKRQCPSGKSAAAPSMSFCRC
jgi:hypothetical protein